MNRLTLNGGAAVRLLHHDFPERAARARHRSCRPATSRSPRRRSTTGKDLTPRAGRRLRPVRQRQDGAQGELSAATSSASAPTDAANPVTNLAITVDAVVDRRQPGLRAGLRPARTRSANGECGADLGPELRQHEARAPCYDPAIAQRLGHARRYNWEFSAGVQHELAAAGRPQRRLLPPRVRQLHRHRQPRRRAGRLHGVQRHGAGRSAAARRRRLHRSAASTT